MRAGSCSVPQTLTAEAASVLKHSLSLARRRGHAQVTPLHVAATLLSSKASLLRRACLRSQPQNLQCRALDLCFNVALNRLPTTTTSSTLLHSTAAATTLSNALRAALKRAQAHQRRGSIEQNQQVPLLAIKVEIEQLVMSILDDPSVSRVMREAGFSSAAVKSSLEEDCSVFQGFASGTCNTGGVFSSPCSPSLSERDFRDTHFFNFPSEHYCNPALLKQGEDLKVVLDVMLRRKRKNAVIVGQSTEGIVAGVMRMLEAKHLLPEELRSTELVRFQLSRNSLKFMRREDVVACFSDLKRRVESNGVGGAIIFLGDLKWTCCDENDGEGLLSRYSPVDHLVSEIGKLVSEAKVWLLATASYKGYLSCQIRRPPLEIQWALQPVSVLPGGHGFTLHFYCIHDSTIFPEDTLFPLLEAEPAISKEEEGKLVCCEEECSFKFEREAELFNSTHSKPTPSFLQPFIITAPHQKDDDLHELKSKWKRICCSLHNGRSPSLLKNHNWLYPLCSNTHNTAFCDSNSKADPYSISLGSLRNTNTNTNTSGDKEVKIILSLGNSEFFGESEKLSKKVEQAEKCRLTILENVPWQSETIPLIVAALMGNERSEKETWLLIEGNDIIGKRRLARVVAESVFSSLLCLDMSKRDDSYSEILAQALTTHTSLVVLVEKADFADDRFMNVLADNFETGKSADSDIKEGACRRIIYILTIDDDTTEKTTLSSVVPMMLQITDSTPSSTTSDRVDHKRKAERDVSIKKTKSPRRGERDESLKLDLNMRAEEEESCLLISSDLTTRRDRRGFLHLIKNRYVFECNPLEDGRMRSVFLSKLEEIALGLNIHSFGVEEAVLEHLVLGSGSFPNGLFDEWVKGVFEASLKIVKIGGRGGGGGVRLCFGGKEERVFDRGFMGSCLPKQIQTSL